jgi:hypothetical protein
MKSLFALIKGFIQGAFFGIFIVLGIIGLLLVFFKTCS